MSKVVLLDAGPLGMITHPRKNPEVKISLQQLLRRGTAVMVPEIADYEVRRELLRAGKKKGVERLDALKIAIGYIPLTTETMLKAAEFWAEARRQGQPTADDKALDADVILAAQTVIISGRGRRSGHRDDERGTPEAICRSEELEGDQITLRPWGALNDG